jgi:hypothetical protein
MSSVGSTDLNRYIVIYQKWAEILVQQVEDTPVFTTSNSRGNSTTLRQTYTQSRGNSHIVARMNAGLMAASIHQCN